MTERIAAEAGLAINPIGIGRGLKVADAYGQWREVRQVADSGCVVVRPDNHVFWRAERYTPDAAESLRAGIAAMLGRRA